MNESLLNMLKKCDLFKVHKDLCEVIIEQSTLDNETISKLLENLISSVYEIGLERKSKY